MTEQTTHYGVSFEAELPLEWRVEPLPHASVLAGWMQTNATLLKALATLETAPAEKESEFSAAPDKMLDRLETKVDLLLALTAQILQQHVSLPPLRHIKLTAGSIEWLAPEAPAPGDIIIIALHLSAQLPRPLMLPARVASIEPAPDNMRRCSAALVNLSEEAQTWLERTIFRYHRRAIQTRQR